MVLALIVKEFKYSEIIYDNTILVILESQKETLIAVTNVVDRSFTQIEGKVVGYYRQVM